MTLENLFVGAVSTVVGCLGVAAGIANWDNCFQSAKVQWIMNKSGRTGARVIFVCGGAFFIVLGIAIACGFDLNKYVGESATVRAARPAVP